MLETAAKIAKKFQSKFPKLTKKVLDVHAQICPWGGHDVFHALIVAQYCAIIAPNEKLAELAWVAGLLHNTDRIFSDEKIKEKLAEYLALTSLSDLEKIIIKEAVLSHSGLNRYDDNPVAIVLKDADRLAGLGPISPIRAGQCFPNVFVFNPRYISETSPGSSYKSPKTILDCLKFVLEWRAMLRVPKAKEIAEDLCRRHQENIEFLEKMTTDLGLDAFEF